MTKSELLETNINALTIFEAQDKMLSVEDCATYLKVHPNTVKNRIEKKVIIALFHGGKYHIPKIQFLKDFIKD